MISQVSDKGDSAISRPQFDTRARVAIDLGAESCRVSLLRWQNSRPVVELLHRIPNGPIHQDGGLIWPMDDIIAGLEAGLRKAAEVASGGIASIAVDGWAVDYVRLDESGEPYAAPFCYRDERTIQSKRAADNLVDPEWIFGSTGAQPLRINTVYQLFADQLAGVDPQTRWLCLPEYILFRLGARAVAEYTNTTHTGLVDLETEDWSQLLLDRLGMRREAFPPIVSVGTVVGKLRGPLRRLDAFRNNRSDCPCMVSVLISPLDLRE